MSTNTEHGFRLPDEAELTALANQFFAALPKNQLPLQGQSESDFTRSGESSIPHHIPRSVTGSGASPSASGHAAEFNVKDPPTSLPDPHFAGKGLIPPSVAGSGKSPGSFHLKDKNAKANGDSSSAVEDPLFNGQRLFEGALPYENELKEILKSVQSYFPGNHLPFDIAAPGVDPFFYFLTGKNFASTAGISTNSFSPKKHLDFKPPFDVNQVRKDFPILHQSVNGRPLVWLDNAATTQKPRQVIERLSYFYEHENSNIHRAAHELAARATDAYEAARGKVQGFLNASSPNEIVFVRGSTEAINLVAQSWGDQNLKQGDEIVISHLEHHANIVPWQQLAQKKALRLRVIPVDDDGQILLDEYSKLLGPRTKLVSVTQVSNALGTVTPVKKIIEMAHQAGAKVLVDGAQAVSHMRADVRYLDCDWYVFSGHKVFGPTGIGVLYGKEALLNETQPWQGGGNMIADVTFDHTTYQQAPSRYEAGTGNIADAVGLGAAIDYVNKIGIDFIQQYEHALLGYATNLLKDVPGLRLIGTAPEKAGVLSFILDGFKTEDVGGLLNQEGIAVRSGHHCAQPILRRFGVESTIRPSLAFYNTCEDIDALVKALYNLRQYRI